MISSVTPDTVPGQGVVRFTPYDTTKMTHQTVVVGADEGSVLRGAELLNKFMRLLLFVSGLLTIAAAFARIIPGCHGLGLPPGITRGHF